MEYFLENIACSLYAEFGNTLNRHCLVFPNRRAGLFFMKYLAAKISKPIWTPSVLTVNELFRSLSSLQSAGNEVLLFELYKVYRKTKKSPESFDEFYFWGDMLLDDFDDIDKYLVNAQLLFTNVLDIKNIDQQFGGLTGSQIETIKKFWVNFNPEKPTREKSGFTDIWSVLNNIYSGFRNAVMAKNIAYEGMIFREVAERTDDEYISTVKWDMVHFIGFNALNECEKVLMKRFGKAGKARFYWDYDNSYIMNDRLNSAGFFMRDNLKVFGNDMPSGWNYDTLLSSAGADTRRRAIETSSDVAQVKLVPGLLRDLTDLTEETSHQTAIVIADENLLIPVLTSLPDNIGDINITMGYPLKHTMIYTFLRQLMELQRNASVNGEDIRFERRDVISILKNSLMSEILSEPDSRIAGEISGSNLLRISSSRFSGSVNLSVVFSRPSSPARLSGYFKSILVLIAAGNENKTEDPGNNAMAINIRNEFIYGSILSINRLETIVNSSDVSFSTDTYMRILDRMLRSQSVPFSGEPLTGIQIMGILETRALDFKNLIILSVNEGILPSVSSGSSFIPFTLRDAFGLPSINHQESIYAYHFYRLLQRAEDVTFVYNSNSEGLRNGEMSRFLVQMKYDPLLKPEFLNLSFEIKSHATVGEKVERSEEHIRLLHERYIDKNNRRVLSPSAINTWLNCRMKFLYRYVNGLKEPVTVLTDIEAALLGEILHDIMRNLYSGFINRILDSERIELIIRDKKLIEQITSNAINEKFGSGTERSIQGSETIVREVLKAYILKILQVDKSLTAVRILGLEESFSFPVSFLSSDSKSEVMVGGIVDRIDQVEGIARIVDYKTGSVADSISSIDDLFLKDRKKETDCWLQTLLYCEAFQVNNPGIIIRPSVYKIRKLVSPSNTDKLRIRVNGKNEIAVDDYRIVRDDFFKNLEITISDIFSRDIPFTMTDDIGGKCSWCCYRELCVR